MVIAVRRLDGWRPLLPLLALLLPPCRALTEITYSDDIQGRRFGGYRIVPKSCTVGGEWRTGICMFNYDCSKRNGTVIGSCTDGFLFGACCRLPPGSEFVAVHVPSSTAPSSAMTPQSIPTTTKVEGASADTVLLHEDGSPANEPFRPDDFFFNSRPELFIANETTPSPGLIKATSKSTTESWMTTKGLTRPVHNSIHGSTNKPSTYMTSPRPSTSKYQHSTSPNYYTTHDFTYNRIPTVPIMEEDIEEATNAESIFHILSILNDTSPGQPDETGPPVTPTSWTSVKKPVRPAFNPSSKYPDKPTINKHTTPMTSTYFTTSKPALITGKPNKPYNSNKYTTQKPKFTSKATTTTKRPYSSNTKKPQSQYHYTKKPPQVVYSTGSHYTNSQNTIYTQVPEVPSPNNHYHHQYTTAKPQAGYIVQDADDYQTIQRPQGPNYQYLTNQPSGSGSTTTTFVQLPGIQVTPEVSITPKPGVSSTHEPVPTVIVLAPLNNTSNKRPTNKPTITITPQQGSIIAVNTDGNIVTYRPQTNSQAVGSTPHRPPPNYAVNYTPVPTTPPPPKPIHGSNNKIKPVPTLHDPVAVYTTAKPYPKPEIYNPGSISSTPQYEPVRPLFTTPTQVIKDAIPNTTEILIAFPPDRDPYANISHQRPQEPEVVSWLTTLPADDYDDATGLDLVEDTNFDDKVHSFVEKIVQSLQGNFVDLENVLIDGQNTSSPNKRPTTTKKPPRKKPGSTSATKPTTTQPLITRPPPRPGSTTKRPVKKPQVPTTFKPSSPTTTIFLDVATELPVPSTVAQPEVEVDYRTECGVRPLMKNGRIVGGKGSTFGEWPWQVLVREATWLGLFTKNKCGGVLITSKFVITAAHCQPGFLASLIAVFGEYDISGELESKRSVTRNVRRVIVHRYYNAATFENDISLLELESPVVFDQHIVPICMPKDDDDFTGRIATVTGWGRLKYGGGVPSVLQEVQVPVIDNSVCQEMFHTAGHSKTILSSFICAGYANGQRDSCEGDSGGPLMVERDDGHWVLAGTVSHGIKCAAPYLPGVYMRTTFYKPWLQTITSVRDY